MNKRTLLNPMMPLLLLAALVVSLVACGGGGSSNQTNQLPLSQVDLTDGPFLFEQNLFTSVFPARITSTSAGGNVVTTTEISYSRATRTLSRISGISSGGNNIAALETTYEFNELGQVILETLLNNGSLTQVIDNQYANGLLVRREYRTTFDGEPELVRTLEYDDMGRYISGELVDPSTNEVTATVSREYSERGWISTTIRGPAITTIMTELDDNGRVISSVETTRVNGGSLSRTTTQSFNENNSRITRLRLRSSGDLVLETQYSEFMDIGDIVQDRLYQWQVFFEASDF